MLMCSYMCVIQDLNPNLFLGSLYDQGKHLKEKNYLFWFKSSLHGPMHLVTASQRNHEEETAESREGKGQRNW